MVVGLRFFVFRLFVCLNRVLGGLCCNSGGLWVVLLVSMYLV